MTSKSSAQISELWSNKAFADHVGNLMNCCRFYTGSQEKTQQQQRLAIAIKPTAPPSLCHTGSFSPSAFQSSLWITWSLWTIWSDNWPSFLRAFKIPPISFLLLPEIFQQRGMISILWHFDFRPLSKGKRLCNFFFYGLPQKLPEHKTLNLKTSQQPCHSVFLLTCQTLSSLFL